jgi:hypothetical protein
VSAESSTRPRATTILRTAALVGIAIALDENRSLRVRTA